jgi:hypothetical protein
MFRLVFACILSALDPVSARADNERPMELLENQSGKLVLAISMQWEGETLSQHNLDAITKFRENYESISMMQFINPVYFTKPKADATNIRQKINSVIRKNDAIGLQLLGWQSLVKDSGVIFRNSPTFWGNTISAKACSVDCGHEVPLSVYSREELVKLMKHSIELLTANGFKTPSAFMAGGWMATNQVLEAAVISGLKYDFSGIPPHIVQEKIRQFPLYQWINELWDKTTALSQPSPLPTQVGWIEEYYNNGGTLDYITEKDIVDMYHGYANLLKQDPSKAYLIHIGLYQETAAKTLPRLEAALQKIFADSTANNIPIAMLQIPSTDKRADSQDDPAAKVRNRQDQVSIHFDR